MKTTTIKLTNGCLGSETMKVRCQLANAASPVEVDYCTGEGWQPTQYQCADARHTAKGLAAIGQSLAEIACEEKGQCDWTEID